MSPQRRRAHVYDDLDADDHDSHGRNDAHHDRHSSPAEAAGAPVGASQLQQIMCDLVRAVNAAPLERAGILEASEGLVKFLSAGEDWQEDFLPLAETACRSPTLDNLEAATRVALMLGHETCILQSQTEEKEFLRISDTQWVVQDEAGPYCGMMDTSRFILSNAAAGASSDRGSSPTRMRSTGTAFRAARDMAPRRAPSMARPKS